LNYIAKCIFKKSNKINYIDKGDILILQNCAQDPYIDDVIVANTNSEIYITFNTENRNESFIRVVKPESMHLYEEKLEKLAKRAKIDGKQWRMYYNFKKKFTDVKQSFSVTLHKSQGSTVDRVFIESSDLPWTTDKNLSFRLFYVGITRTSDKAIISY